MPHAEGEQHDTRSPKITDALQKMKLEELRALHARIEERINEKQAEAWRTAREEIESVAKKHGFKLADLLPSSDGPAKRRKGSSVYRYVDPQRPALNWSGRGRRPTWLTELIEAGHSKDEFLVAK